MELLRQGPQALVQQHGLLGLDGQFAAVGLHQASAHARNVTDVPEIPEGLVGLGTEAIPGQVALNAPTAVLQGNEAGLAHHPAQHHPAGDGGGHRIGVEPRFVPIPVLRLKRRGDGLGTKIVGESAARRPPLIMALAAHL